MQVIIPVFSPNIKVELSESEYNSYKSSGTVGLLFVVHGGIPAYSGGLGSPNHFTVTFTEELFFNLPPDPVKPHHVFAGWFLDEAFTVRYYSQTITANMPLYAKFVINRYTVTYVTNNGETKPAETMDALTLHSPSALSRTGFNFGGWYTDAALTTAYNPNAPLEGNITLYAKWNIIILTVSFMVDGAVYAVIDVPWGTTFQEAISAVETDGQVISAIFSDANHFNALNINGFITDDMNIHAELTDGFNNSLGFFARVGSWFGTSWPWLAACVGSVFAGGGLLFLIQKKRGVV
jgi:uncharacterized repeat protein (TIGR02543 family)